MSLQNALILSGVLIAMAVAAGFVGLRVFYGSIYKFDQNPGDPQQLGLDGIKIVDFKSEDDADIKAWIKTPEDGAPVILYFMGNFASIGPSVQRLKPFLDQGFGLAALVYRGSSGQGGIPAEENFAADARALYDQLDVLMGMKIPEEQRVAHGYSLGSGIAVRLASERPVAGLVLEAAFARFCDYFTDRYYGLPFCYVMNRERYDSIDRIGKIQAPILVLHGEKDTAINIRSARRLFDAAREPKHFIAYENGTHVNLSGQGLLKDVPAFYSGVVPGAGTSH